MKIASTLKPIRSVQAYWESSRSIEKTNKDKYEIHILENSSKKRQAHPKKIPSITARTESK